MVHHDCNPTLNDSEVLEFCKRGFLILENVVPDTINQKTIDYLEARASSNAKQPGEPTELLGEDWFVDNVILSSQGAGVIRTLLGLNFGLPILISHHRMESPRPSQEWRINSNAKHGPELHHLQGFYFPQACPMEMGPIELLPGTHFIFSTPNYVTHYGRIQGGHYVTVPPGSILLMAYSIWHRRLESTAQGSYNTLEYSYFRTVPPQRDWIIDPDFDMATADYTLGGAKFYGNDFTFRQQHRDCYDNAEMYFWLCGKSDKFRAIGGQAWPKGKTNFMGKPYGVPEWMDEEQG